MLDLRNVSGTVSGLIEDLNGQIVIQSDMSQSEPSNEILEGAITVVVKRLVEQVNMSKVFGSVMQKYTALEDAGNTKVVGFYDSDSHEIIINLIKGEYSQYGVSMDPMKIKQDSSTSERSVSSPSVPGNLNTPS